MVDIYRFKGYRPAEKQASKVPSVPYDVVSRDESRQILQENPESFLKVIRSDALLPDSVEAESDEVYDLAQKNLASMIENGTLVQDDVEAVYLYRVKQGGNIYTGLVANISTGNYQENRIKRHEHTRYDKEQDRTRHIDMTNAHTGLVVLLYRDPGEVFSYLNNLVSEEPDSVVKTENGVVHELFCIREPAVLDAIEKMFSGIDALYIADGHHRAKSSVNVVEKRTAEGRLTPEAERFMAIIFAADRVKIHGYSRLVTDLGDYTRESFLAALKERFDIRPYGEIDHTVFQIPPLRDADSNHVMHMYLGGIWYELSTPVADPDDPIASLDVSVLQKDVLEGMLGITDPRGDPRLQYLGGARPLSDLMEKVDWAKFTVAFSMQPVQVESVLSIADAGDVMPPKSTWFEPKLLSGLVVHKID